jgi:hypothetical protein
MIAYISIGNSDDRLTQKKWAGFNIAIMARIKPLATVTHGEWSSAPWAPYQNACWCLEFPDDPRVMTEVREVLAEIRDDFGQDSIAFATATTEFI